MRLTKATCNFPCHFPIDFACWKLQNCDHASGRQLFQVWVGCQAPTCSALLQLSIVAEQVVVTRGLLFLEKIFIPVKGFLRMFKINYSILISYKLRRNYNLLKFYKRYVTIYLNSFNCPFIYLFLFIIAELSLCHELSVYILK